MSLVTTQLQVGSLAMVESKTPAKARQLNQELHPCFMLYHSDNLCFCLFFAVPCTSKALVQKKASVGHLVTTQRSYAAVKRSSLTGAAPQV